MVVRVYVTNNLHMSKVKMAVMMMVKMIMMIGVAHEWPPWGDDDDDGVWHD